MLDLYVSAAIAVMLRPSFIEMGTWSPLRAPRYQKVLCTRRRHRMCPGDHKGRLKGTPRKKHAVSYLQKLNSNLIHTRRSVDLWPSSLTIDNENHKHTVVTSASLYLNGPMWRHEQGRHVWHKCTLRHKLTFDCSSLVKNGPTCLRPLEDKFGVKNTTEKHTALHKIS